MMPAHTLLNINPDKLFEEYSVSDIEEVQKKLNYEIERKREELRTVVGERYRDLIEAADTITQMKELSEKVISDVSRIKAATANLQERQVSGFKIEYRPKERKSNVWSSSALQIKILVDISEQIWQAVDHSQFTKATLLYLMARYLKTSLEINPSYNASTCFPVVSRQWFSLIHFKNTILKRAEEKLMSQHDSEVTCSGLLSLALLENLSCEELLDRYLALRSEALRVTLTPPLTTDTIVIKQRLFDSYTLLIHTVIAVSHCFLEHFSAKEGLLLKYLNNYIGPQSPPTLSFLDQEVCDIPVSLLPSAVTQFRPILETELRAVNEGDVVEAVRRWLNWVQTQVTDQGGQLLSHVSSLRSLHDLRHPPLVSEEWPLVAQKLCSVDLWGDMYRTLITERAKQLVSVHWNNAFRTLETQVSDAFHTAIIETKQSEVDLVWYMWKQSTNDLSNLNDLKTSRGLWLKAKGVTPRVADLCAGLERKVSSLASELVILCPNQEVDPPLLAISHTLRMSQQAVCASVISHLVDHVRGLGSKTKNEGGVIMLAKFLQSVPELCPSLSKCLSSADTKVSFGLLQTQCLALYQVWSSLASERILRQFLDTLGSASPHLNSIPQWEEIVIEEEGENGEKIESVLKVPCTASLTLQTALHQLVTAVGHVAVPKQIAEHILEKMLVQIVEVHQKNLENNLTQTQFLQLLLDMKYLVYLYNGNITKDLLRKYEETISKIESKIDPFDLNVFTPHLNNNVRASVNKTQALLGLGGSATVASTQSHRNEEPSVLAISASAASNSFFPLLHITAPRPINPVVKSKIKKSAQMTQVQSNSENGVKPTTTSSSFFGAMASDWFG